MAGSPSVKARGCSQPSPRPASLWTLPQPWTPRTRPTLLGKRPERVSHSVHRRHSRKSGQITCQTEAEKSLVNNSELLHSRRRRFRGVGPVMALFVSRAGELLRIRRSNCELLDEDGELDSLRPLLRSSSAVPGTSHAPGG